MVEKKYRLHNGKKGTALAVRVIPRASKNEIVEIMSDGTIKIRLAASTNEAELNTSLVSFLASVLGISSANIEVVGGLENRSKLISVLDMDSSTAHERVLEHLI